MLRWEDHGGGASMADFLFTCLVCVGAGLALRRLGHPPEAAHLLRDLIIKVLLPATVAGAILQVEFHLSWLLLPAAMIGCSLATLAILAALQGFGMRLGTAAQNNVVFVLAPFAAPGITAIPFIAAGLGPEGLAQASLGHIGWVIAYTLGTPLVVALACRNGMSSVARPSVWRRLGREPILLGALAAGVGVTLDVGYSDLPAAVQQTLELLTSLLAPLVLVFVGLTVRVRSRGLRVVLCALSLRLAIGLALAASMLALLPLGPILPILLVVLPLSAPPLYGIAAIYAAPSEPGQPEVFDREFALDLFGVAFPACMVAVLAALLVPALATDPGWLALASLVPLALLVALQTMPALFARRRVSGGVDEHGTEIVDVGERGPGQEKVAHRRERRIGVVAGE